MRVKSSRFHTLRRLLVAAAMIGMTQVAVADEEYAADWGPEVGTQAPLLAASDQTGEQRSVATLTGSNGLLLVFNRSVDW